MVRVIDCFPYNGEAIALFRLAYLWDVVDEFIIVEAAETHSGNPKVALFLDLFAAAFAPFAAKLTRLVIESFPARAPESRSNAAGTAWYKEKYQRNYPGAYLSGLTRPWIVLGCDVDEIPRREVIASLPARYAALAAGFRLQMAIHYYSSRWIKADKWYHAFVATDKTMEGATLDTLRTGPFIKKALGDAGWHLSYFMGDEDIRRKIRSAAHMEHNSGAANRLDWIVHCMETGRDLYRPGEEDCTSYAGDDLPQGLRAFEAAHGIGAPDAA